MLLDVSKALRAPGEEIAFTHRDEIPPQEIFGDTVTFDPVVMTGYYSMMDHNLRLRGRLQTIAHGECAGCFAPVDYEVDVPFDETFLHISREKTYAGMEDELETDDDERLAFEGSKVELHQLALTLTLLDLPIRFECEPVCQVMEKARQDNESHACQKELPDQHPFSALQQLLTKDQEV